MIRFGLKFEVLCRSHCGAYSELLNPVIYEWTSPEQGSLPRCENGKYPPMGTQPQIFRNCVDIRIESNGGGSGEEVDMSTPSPPSEDMPELIAQIIGQEVRS